MEIKKLILFAGLCGGTFVQGYARCLPVTESPSDLSFTELASSWDEGVPLGNAVVGALVWQKGNVMRFSLDRTDLWDLRPMERPKDADYRFAWVKEQIRKKDYLPVQQVFDHPYDRMPAPSKIPGAALEFSLDGLGVPNRVHLYLNNALCQVEWPNGMQMQTFVHATEPVGWFVFTNLPSELEPMLVPPVYNIKGSSAGEADPVSGQSLQRLGYVQGDVVRQGDCWVYHQNGYEDFSYDVVVGWKREGNKMYGVWSVTSSLSDDEALRKVKQAMRRGFKKDYKKHLDYWNGYWARANVALPDTLLQKQYDNEMYKLGSSTREHSYPISLQSVWTADNGLLPPWKGDYHHDLNTELSYWPVYTGNRLSEGLGYVNTMWNQREVYKRYTRSYFETDGMNIPGVCTLQGEPMGGWIQYAMSQTVGAWLARYFYLHWKYSADRKFLKDRAYPFMREVAVYMEQQSEKDEKGVRKLEFSSSPEIYDNSLKAWFPNMTNFDLALMYFIFDGTSELAGELGLEEEARHWAALKKELPDFDVDSDGALTFAKDCPYDMSHRHFSHALAVHPLGIIDWSKGDKDQRVISATLKKLKDFGPGYWTGYSYSWYANMQARAFNGEEAVQALRTFAECFCLRNTFHVNGDQSGTGKSLYTYRPFTLEGNFAFAAGVHEMLLQSHTGSIRVFPAVPKDWGNVSFENLRAMGAFLVSASRENGKVTRLKIFSEKGRRLRFVSPLDGTVVERDTRPGEWINIIG